MPYKILLPKTLPLKKKAKKWLAQKSLKTLIDKIESIVAEGKNLKRALSSDKDFKLLPKKILTETQCGRLLCSAPKFNYGNGQVFFYKKYVVKIGAKFLDEPPKNVCPTIVISAAEEIYIQPKISMSKHKSIKLRNDMMNICYDGHEFNWGFWGEYPVFFDW